MGLNILYQFSNWYAPYAGLSILSLFENNQKIDIIRLFVLDDGVSDENKKKLSKIANDYGRKIEYIPTKKIAEKLEKYNVPKFKGSYATYFKLFGMSYLPKDVEKILYIDSDTIVMGDLSELINLDLEDAPCAMVLDPIFDKYKDILGIGRESYYFNCGVGLYNVEKWKEVCEPQILDMLKNEQSSYFIVDQDMINLLYSKQIKLLPLKYNLTGVFVLYTSEQLYKLYDYNKNTMYSREEIDSAVEKPVICHYIAYQVGRPWEMDNIHPMTKYFDDYLEKSPWKGMHRIKASNSKLIQIQRKCYQILPRKIYIMIHKLILSLSMERIAKSAVRKG